MSRTAEEGRAEPETRDLFDPPLKPEPRPVGSEAPARRPSRTSKRRRRGDSAPLSLPLFPELEDDTPVDPVDAEVDELDVDPPLDFADEDLQEEVADPAEDLLAASVEDAGEEAWADPGGSDSDSSGPSQLGFEELGPDGLGPDEVGPDELGPDELGPGDFGGEELPSSPTASDPEDPFDVPVRLRALAGLADLAVHGALLLLVLLGERLVGMRWDLDQWPGLATFLLTFSFLYTVVPLAFWGQTPGMSVAGILACTEEGENLSFPQTAARWAAGLLTLLLLGLPLVAALWGPALSDRLSQSLTRRALG